MKIMNQNINSLVITCLVMMVNVFGATAIASSCVQPPSGIVAWWPFDETTGNVAEDRAGNHVGAYANNPIPSEGKVGGALRFNGTNYVAVPDSNEWAFGSKDFTIELWANFDVPGGGSIGHPGDIFIGNDEGPGTRNKWFFALGGGKLNFHINGPAVGSWFFPQASLSPTVGQWYHLAVTKSGTIYSLFIDGKLVATASDSRIIPNANAPLTIGQAEELGFMNGRLDEITIYDHAVTQAELQAIVGAGSSGKCKEIKIEPQTGGDIGNVTLRITGTELTDSTVITLKKEGESDIQGTSISMSADSRVITATFNLIGKTRGLWDVVLTNPDGRISVIPDGFMIEEGRKADVWVDIVGLNLIRPERPQSFQIFYGNRGNVDANGVPIWVSVPEIVKTKLKFILGTSVINSDPDPIDISDVPLTTTVNDQTVIPLFVPTIGPGEINSVQIELAATSGIGSFAIKAWANAPLLNGSLIGQLDRLKCLTDLIRKFLPPNVQCWADVTDQLSELLGQIIFSKERPNVSSLIQTVATILEGCTDVLDKFKRVDEAKKIVDAILYGIDLADCTTLEPPASPNQLPVNEINSFDPNDKVGSLGSGGIGKFLSGTEPLRYNICFENLDTATASAQEVVIIDDLNPNKDRIDLNTLNLDSITFGNNVVTLIPNLNNFATDVDFRPDKNLLVRVNAYFDNETNILTWRFTSIDPATGELTTDPLEGFLPPNTDEVAPKGSGSVSFTVMPKPGLPTGTEISNTATIVFDTNEPIETPVWTNTIDNSKPQSQVSALPVTQSSRSFEISWSGTDEGVGIKDYSIYVSEDNGPFNPWLTSTPATSKIYNGAYGKSYSFYSIARDLTGNVEVTPAGYDTATTVIAEIKPGDFNQDGCVDMTDYNLIMSIIRGSAPYDSNYDLNGDGAINRADARTLIGLFTNPSGAACN